MLSFPSSAASVNTESGLRVSLAKKRARRSRSQEFHDPVEFCLHLLTQLRNIVIARSSVSECGSANCDRSAIELALREPKAASKGGCNRELASAFGHYLSHLSSDSIHAIQLVANHHLSAIGSGKVNSNTQNIKAARKRQPIFWLLRKNAILGAQAFVLLSS